MPRATSLPLMGNEPWCVDAQNVHSVQRNSHYRATSPLRPRFEIRRWGQSANALRDLPHSRVEMHQAKVGTTAPGVGWPRSFIQPDHAETALSSRSAGLLSASSWGCPAARSAVSQPRHNSRPAPFHQPRPSNSICKAHAAGEQTAKTSIRTSLTPPHERWA